MPWRFLIAYLPQIWYNEGQKKTWVWFYMKKNKHGGDVPKTNPLEPIPPDDSRAESMPDKPESMAVTAEEQKGPDESAYGGNLKRQRRKNTISFVFSLAIIGCVVYALWTLSNTLQKGDTATFREVFSQLNWWYILAAFVLFGVMFIMETLKFTVLGKTSGCSLGFRKDMKTALVGKYYECITPFSSGGQPMQIYHLYKSGVPGAKAASITMVKYGVHMLGFTVVAALVMGFGAGQLSVIGSEAMRRTILICGWIGFGINAFIPVFVTLVVFLPRPVSWTVNLFVKLLHKIKLIKNASKWESRIRQWVDDFAIISQFVYKKPKVFLVLFLLCLGEPIIELILPYLVLVAMCGGEVMGYQGGPLLFLVMALAMYATYAATFIPTPGNSGAVETVFMAAFAVLTESVLFWYVIVWRFILYYTWILLGIGMNVHDAFAKLQEKRRARTALPKSN